MNEIQISLILPAYNEVQRISATMQAALDYFRERGLRGEIIVAADGQDGTRELARGMAREHPVISVLGSPQRRGKGRGIREAVAAARGAIIGFADADNKTPITELDKFLPHFEAGWDLVIGSRGQPESIVERRQPLYRRIGSMGFGIFMHSVVGLRDIADTQCGFKFFSAAAARDLFARQVIDGYMFDVEVLYLAQRVGYRIRQVPVRWRDDGDSRLDLLAGNIRNFTDVLQIRLGRRK